jgi:hypothetical protein
MSASKVEIETKAWSVPHQRVMWTKLIYLVVWDDNVGTVKTELISHEVLREVN